MTGRHLASPGRLDCGIECRRAGCRAAAGPPRLAAAVPCSLRAPADRRQPMGGPIPVRARAEAAGAAAGRGRAS